MSDRSGPAASDFPRLPDDGAGPVHLYLVERRLPGMTVSGLTMLHQALTLATGRFSRDEPDLRYLWSVFIPGQDRLLSLFAAQDADLVRSANDASLIPFTGIARAHALRDPAPDPEV